MELLRFKAPLFPGPARRSRGPGPLSAALTAAAVTAWAAAPAQAQWTTETLSQARETVAAVSAGGRVFFAGGFANGGASDVVDVLEPNGSWSVMHLSLLGRGKKPMQAIVAVMRKLLHSIYGMLHLDQDFDGAKFCALAA